MSKTVSEDKQLAVSRELDYKTRYASHPSYKFSKIIPREGAGDQVVAATSTLETNFEIPTKAFNFAKSNLSFTYSIAATVDRYTWVFQDTLPFVSQIQVMTRSGQYLCDLNNVQNYIKIIRKKETAFDEFKTFDSLDLLYPNNNPVGTAYAAAVDATFTPIIQPTIRPITGNTVIGYTEPQYLARSSAVNTVYSANVQFRLDAIKNTILAYDKDLMFPEIIVLRVVWGPGAKSGFTNLVAGAADPTLGTPQALAANTTISSIVLFLAVEQNQAVIDGLMGKIKATGLSLPIDYTQAYKTNASSTNQVLSQKFTRANGLTLKKIITAPFNGTESSNTAMDCNNLGTWVNGAGYPGAGKISSYYTLLDNNRLQEFDVRCSTAAAEDWLLQKKMLKGSVYQNSEQYQYDWFHCDDWSCEQPQSESKSIDDSNLICGLSLAEERKWDMYMTTVSAVYNHYYYATFIKMLVITSTAVTCT